MSEDKDDPKGKWQESNEPEGLLGSKDNLKTEYEFNVTCTSAVLDVLLSGISSPSTLPSVCFTN